MAINDDLLKKARTAGASLAAAEDVVQRSRADYHTIVRRIHLAGASLREIAEALELSHQRVQQIVSGAGGSWWQRVWRSRNLKRNLVCTFCNRSQTLVEKLIAGPKVFICDQCIGTAARNLGGGSSRATTLTPAPEGARARCSFCRKQGTGGRRLLTAKPGNICEECLTVCQQILEDSPA